MAYVNTMLETALYSIAFGYSNGETEHLLLLEKIKEHLTNQSQPLCDDETLRAFLSERRFSYKENQDGKTTWVGLALRVPAQPVFSDTVKSVDNTEGPVLSDDDFYYYAWEHDRYWLSMANDWLGNPLELYEFRSLYNIRTWRRTNYRMTRWELVEDLLFVEGRYRPGNAYSQDCHIRYTLCTNVGTDTGLLLRALDALDALEHREFNFDYYVWKLEGAALDYIIKLEEATRDPLRERVVNRVLQRLLKPYFGDSTEDIRNVVVDWNPPVPLSDEEAIL